MYTSVMLLALSGLAADTSSSSWRTDYQAARELAARQQKPVAIVVGSGQNGWEKLSAAGRLTDEARQLFASKYVCVYVDAATAEGKRLASSFELAGGLGIILSDRSGKLQAFYHEGDLDNQVLATYLQRYADPNRAVTATDINPGRKGHSSGDCGSCGSCGYASYCGSSSYCGSGCGYASCGGGRHRGGRGRCR